MAMKDGLGSGGISCGVAVLLAMACGGDDTASGEADTTGDPASSTDTLTITSADSSSDGTNPDASSGIASSSDDGSDGTTSAGTTGAGTTSAGTTSAGSSESSGSESSSTSGGTLACDVDAELSEMPVLAGAELANDQGFEGSCGVPGSPEAVFTFTAPADDTYAFDALTIHSVANAVLYALDDSCGGVEIDCDSAEYYAGNYAAVLHIDMDAGETITLVAESNGDNSQFEPIDAVEIAVMGSSSCVTDLGSEVPAMSQGSLVGVPNDYVPACNDESSANDAGFLFTAPEDGGYRFAAFNTDYGDELPLFATAGGCDGEQIACSAGFYAAGAPLEIRLTAGETVAVFATGNHDYSDTHFTFEVVAVDIASCPLAEVPGDLPQIVPSSTLGAGNDHAASCGGSFGDDAELTFTAPIAGTYVFAPVSNSIYPIVSVLDGVCEGPELACNDPLAGDIYREPGVVVEMVAGQDVTVVVDDSLGLAGNFSLLVEAQVGDCLDEDIGALAPPFDVVGTTTGATNSSAGSCAGILAPDHGVSWTPLVAGDYTISTLGSSYSSSISVRDAACDGAELACSHNYEGGTGAIANVSLQAGQTVVMLVDGYGYGQSAGDFVIHVEPQQPAGDCCDVTYADSCSNAIIDACVCAADELCCDVWDRWCVDAAISACAADCP